MSTVVNFFGNVYIEPGAAAHIINGGTIPPQLGSFGNAFLLDSGTGAGYGGGSGVAGTLKQGIDAVYEISDGQDMQRFIRGGIFWDAANYLFNPAPGTFGVQTLFYSRAAATTPGTLAFAFSNTGTAGTPTLGVGGTGYVVGDTFTINGGSVLATGTVTAVSGGVVTTFTINTAGAGYTTGTIATTAVTGTGIGLTIAVVAATVAVGGITFSSNNEGLGANGGTVTSVGGTTVVSKGYAAVLRAGTVNTAAFIIDFYEGQYRGLDAYNNNAPYDVAESYCSNNLICSSTEFLNVAQLLTWAANDYQFSLYFTVSASTTSSTQIAPANITTYTGYNLFAGGTETYSSTHVDTILSIITDIDNAFFISDKTGDSAQNVVNTKIITHIQTQATVKEKIVFIGGGNDSTKFTQSLGSIPTAQFFNTPRAVVVHSAVKVPYAVAGGNIQYKFAPSFISACLAMARFSGVEPQVNGTWKTVRITGLKHELSSAQRVTALQSGVLHYRKVTNLGYVINEQVNTMQININTIATNGDSPQISIERIKMQLNKELQLNAAVRFVGGNLATASSEDVRLFVVEYLGTRTVDPNNAAKRDNLIMSFQDIKIKFVQDYWDIQYGFVPNGPINKVFFTGLILDPNIQIGF